MVTWLQQLKHARTARRAHFADAVPIDNSLARAGAPMFYPCATCNDPRGVQVDELWTEKPADCPDCTYLARLEWRPPVT